MVYLILFNSENFSNSFIKFEILYLFVADMVKENVGKGGKSYFPFIFSLFMFILMGNLLGMI